MRSRATSAFCILAAALLGGGLALGESASWTQWGGPNQDFKAQSTGLDRLCGGVVFSGV